MPDADRDALAAAMAEAASSGLRFGHNFWLDAADAAIAALAAHPNEARAQTKTARAELADAEQVIKDLMAQISRDQADRDQWHAVADTALEHEIAALRDMAAAQAELDGLRARIRNDVALTPEQRTRLTAPTQPAEAPDE